MLSDEGLSSAASRMEDAAERIRVAADNFAETVNRLERLIGVGYGNNIERLLQQLEESNRLYGPIPDAAGTNP